MAPSDVPTSPSFVAPSISNLSIATVRARRSGSARSTPRGSVLLTSPPPDGRFFHDANTRSEVDEELQYPHLEAARVAYEESDDLYGVKEALGTVLAIADRLLESLAALRASHSKLQSTNRTLQQTQTELETSLVLEKSNLALERANNEMLEEALKRDGGNKDIGWKRWSEREGLKRSMTPDRLAMARNTSGTMVIGDLAEPKDAEGRRRSMSTGSSGGTALPSTSASPTVSHPPPTPPVALESSRFFKFRFGAGARDPTSKTPTSTPPNRSPIMPHATGNGAQPAAVPLSQSHLTSASLPSLLPGSGTAPSPASSRPPSPPPTKEALNSLASELALTKAQLANLHQSHSALQTSHTSLAGSHKTLSDAKTALDEEIETLSQALFEEANRMVADERKKRAAFEEELEVCRAEREALKGALRVVEAENGAFRSGKVETADGQAESWISEEGDEHHDDTGSDSSLHAIKSQPSSPIISVGHTKDEPEEVALVLPPDDFHPTNLDLVERPRTNTPSGRHASYNPVYI